MTSLVDVGLDTSTKRLAWHGGADGPVGFYDAPGDNPESRRLGLYRRAKSFFESLPPGSWVYCEEPLALPKNGLTTRLLGLAAGAVWAAHLDCDIVWVWVDASAWKGREHGIGLVDIKREIGTRKDKVAVAVWGQRRLHGSPDLECRRWMYDRCPDLWDAWAIREWGVKQRARAT